MIIPYVFSHDNILKGVKQEASLLAVRKKDDKGEVMFDELVFDEGYLILFRQYFFEGQSKLIPVLSVFMNDLPDDGGYFEPVDFSKNRDFTFELNITVDFPKPLLTVIDINIKEYLIAYIMHRWLETKLSGESKIYESRADVVKEGLKSHLLKRTRPIRREHRMF